MQVYSQVPRRLGCWFGPMAQLDAAAFDGLFAANVLAIFFLVAALVPAGRMWVRIPRETLPNGNG